MACGGAVQPGTDAVCGAGFSVGLVELRGAMGVSGCASAAAAVWGSAWEGEAGGTVLVYAEQGLRYGAFRGTCAGGGAADGRWRAAGLVVEVQRSLVRLRTRGWQLEGRFWACGAVIAAGDDCRRLRRIVR